MKKNCIKARTRRKTTTTNEQTAKIHQKLFQHNKGNKHSDMQRDIEQLKSSSEKNMILFLLQIEGTSWLRLDERKRVRFRK